MLKEKKHEWLEIVWVIKEYSKKSWSEEDIDLPLLSFLLCVLNCEKICIMNVCKILHINNSLLMFLFCFIVNTLAWTISYLPLWLKFNFCRQWIIFLTAFATKNIMLLPADILSPESNIMRHILSTICIHKQKKTTSLNLHKFYNFQKTNPPCLPQRVKLNAVFRQYKKKTSTSVMSLSPLCYHGV